MYKEKAKRRPLIKHTSFLSKVVLPWKIKTDGGALFVKVSREIVQDVDPIFFAQNHSQVTYLVTLEFWMRMQNVLSVFLFM